jgi:hypothetical protein
MGRREGNAATKDGTITRTRRLETGGMMMLQVRPLCGRLTGRFGSRLYENVIYPKFSVSCTLADIKKIHSGINAGKRTSKTHGLFGQPIANKQSRFPFLEMSMLLRSIFWHSPIEIGRFMSAGLIYLKDAERDSLACSKAAY